MGGVANYTGALEDVLRCLTAQGQSGCGFESPFAAIARALGVDGRGPSPPDNQGFLRPDAALAIILLTNEDDCSVPPELPLFDTTVNTNLMSQLGPLTNFRCNEFGHLCARGGGPPAHPDRSAPGNNVAATVSYDSCVSNDTEGYELSAQDTAARLKTLKDDPSRIVVASIQGPASPYVVHWRPPSANDTSCGATSCPWPEITHACTSTDGSWADPGVRTQQMTMQFGSNGLVVPICADSYAPALQQIATAIGQLFVPGCIRSTLVDDPSKPGIQPNCTVTGHAPQPNGSTTDSPVPACADTAGVGPCWTPTRQDSTCSGGVAFLYTPDPAAPGAITSVTIQCPLCTAAVNEPMECY